MPLPDWIGFSRIDHLMRRSSSTTTNNLTFMTNLPFKEVAARVGFDVGACNTSDSNERRILFELTRGHVVFASAWSACARVISAHRCGHRAPAWSGHAQAWSAWTGIYVGALGRYGSCRSTCGRVNDVRPPKHSLLRNAVRAVTLRPMGLPRTLIDCRRIKNGERAMREVRRVLFAAGR